jgi:hypothetical protein
LFSARILLRMSGSEIVSLAAFRSPLRMVASEQYATLAVPFTRSPMPSLISFFYIIIVITEYTQKSKKNEKTLRNLEKILHESTNDFLFI